MTLLPCKYSEEAKIRSNSYPELDGQELRWQYIRDTSK